MKQQIQEAIVKAAKTYWLFVSERDAAIDRMFQRADGKLSAFVLVYGKKRVSEVLQANGIPVPVCVEIPS
jgi:hypothetical protein